MSGEREASVRHLPAGQLKNIKKLFDNGANSETSEMDNRPVPPARPAVPPLRKKFPAAQPKAQPRNNLSTDKNAFSDGSSCDLKDETYSKRHPPGISNRISSLIGEFSASNKSGNYSCNNSVNSPLEKSAADSRSNSPSVSVAQRISNSQSPCKFGNTSPNRHINEKDTISESGQSDVYSKVTKRRETEAEVDNQTPRSSTTVLTRREAVRKNDAEKRRTVGFFQMDDSSEDSRVSVASRLKIFDQQKSGEKPSPPRKPEAIRRHTSLRSPKELSPPIVEDSLYEIPWDKNKDSSVEKLKRMALKDTPIPSRIKPDSSEIFSTSLDKAQDPVKVPLKPVITQKPSLPNTPPPRISHLTKKSSEPSPNVSSVSKRPTDSPPPKPTTAPSKSSPAPPPKPPRTHAHDDYFRTKIISPGPDKGNERSQVKSVQTVQPREEEEKREGCLSVQDRIVRMQKQQQQSNGEEEESVTMRNERLEPPSRPPPPKRRPSSSDSPCSPLKLNPNEGPMLIRINAKPQISRQNSVQPKESRKPSDELPQTPGKPIKGFPLRKSMSSECVYKSRSHSIDEENDDDGHSQMTRSSYETEYEAVIDPDGYAVPNEFLKLPVKKLNSDISYYGDGECPSKFLTRIEGFEAQTPLKGKRDGNFNQDASPGFGASTSRHEQCLEKVNKKKLLIVKQKINQAYADLDSVFRAISSPVDTESDDVVPELEETIVDQSVLRKRIEHCSSIRIKSRMSVKKSKEYLSAVYPQLFEYCLVVGLQPLTNEPGYEPFVIHKFPENVSSNLSVPNFCFPDAQIFKPGSMLSLSESYSFVMTYEDGSRVYGYCRRMQLSDVSLPEVICIISPIDAFNMYNTLLNEIEARRRISLDLASEVIAASFGRPLPKPGKVCHIRTLDQSGEMETIFLERPSDNRLGNVNYESPLCSLGTDKLVKVFSSMLMERRIILCSSNLSVLTETVHALCALLYPFQWQHVYIPLLPAEMLDVVCAPMPYICGILTAYLPQVFDMELEEVFVVDLDKKSIVRNIGDEATLIPRKIQRALKTAINYCKIDNEARNAQWLMVAEAFLRMFIELVGHFGSHVCTQQDGNRIFQKEGFIVEMVSKENRQFLEWFTETQMFEVFIANHVEKSDWGSCELFMQRLQDYRETQEDESRRHRGPMAKVKNFGKAIKTKLEKK